MAAEIQKKRWKFLQGVGLLTAGVGVYLLAKSWSDLTAKSQGVAEYTIMAGVAVFAIGWLGGWWNHG